MIKPGDKNDFKSSGPQDRESKDEVVRRQHIKERQEFLLYNSAFLLTAVVEL